MIYGGEVINQKDSFYQLLNEALLTATVYRMYVRNVLMVASRPARVLQVTGGVCMLDDTRIGVS